MLGLIRRPHVGMIGLMALSCLLLAVPNKVWGLEAQNLADLKQQLGFDQYYLAKLKKKSLGRRIKVAVLDNGFFEYQKSLGTALPADTHYMGEVSQSSSQMNTEDIGTAPETPHGRFMAELIYAMMTENGNRTDLAPELYLFKEDGYTNLKKAVDECIRLQVDVVLRSMVREYGSNFDGRGFFNTEVNRALDSGILWVNAAGNFGRATFNLAKIESDGDGWVRLPGVNDSLPIRCEKPKNDSEVCNLRLVLSWNDFKDDAAIGTNKDLDLVLTDDTLDILQTSNLVQTTEVVDRQGLTKYPREIIEMQLRPGRYFVRVKNRSQNFGPQDALRITAEGEFIALEKFDQNESLLNPADNPRVITVGASDSDRSSRSARLGKPEIFAPSLIVLSDSEAYLGTSNSAAIVAAGISLMKYFDPSLTRESILRLVSSYQMMPPKGEGIASVVLGFEATGKRNPDTQEKCFEIVEPPQAAQSYARYIFKRDGVFVNTTAGVKVMVPYDPVQLVSQGRRMQIDDAVLATPQGYTMRSRADMNYMSQGWVEIVQLPARSRLCSLPREWMKYGRRSPMQNQFFLPAPSAL